MKTLLKGFLGGGLTLALALGGTTMAHAEVVTPDPAPLVAPAELQVDAQAVSVDVAVKQILKETNAARQANGLAPLALNSAISKVAQAWSEQQYKDGYISHNPSYSQQIPAGWSWAAENVASGYTYDTVTTGWLNSAGHRANILNGVYTDIGIGYYEKDGKRYFTQNFAAYKRTPGQVSDVTVSNVTPKQATIWWKAPAAGASSYVVTYTAEQGSPKTVETNDTSVILTNLVANTNYKVTIVPRNTSGQGDAATTNFKTLSGAQAPVAPAQPTVSAVADTSFVATWAAPADSGAPITSYEVQVTGPDATLELTTSKPSIKVTDLWAGYSYGVSVRALNSAGASEWSPATSVTTLAEVVAPKAPTGVKLKQVSSTEAVATWNAPSAAAENYTIKLYSGDKLVSSVSSATASVTLKPLTPETAYGITVTAKNSAGTSPASSQVSFTTPAKPVSSEVVRIGGADRFVVSAAISAKTYKPGVPVVYVASGEVFPDALSGSAAAGATGGPVLLVQKNSIPDAIAQELARLKPGKIVVLGGTASVTPKVQNSLGKYSGKVTRIEGADRYVVSAKIAASTFSAGVPVAYVASGEVFPDALSGSAAAGLAGAPVLLVTKGDIPAAVQAELKRLNPGKIVVLGGPNAVSDKVLNKLQKVASTTRIGGTDRYAVSAAIAKLNFKETGGTVYVTSGQKFPDALSGSAAAISNEGPVLLVTDGSIPAPVAAQLDRLKPTRIVILGGEASVSRAVAQELNSYLAK